MIIFVTFNLSSANAFNLVWSKILSHGNGLKLRILCYVYYYNPASKKRGYTVLALSLLPSITSIFHRTFLSNHASQTLQTWYGALARVLHVAYQIQICKLSTSCFTTWFIIRHSVRNQYFPSHFSQSVTMHHGLFKLGMVLWLGILHVAD